MRALRLIQACPRSFKQRDHVGIGKHGPPEHRQQARRGVGPPDQLADGGQDLRTRSQPAVPSDRLQDGLSPLGRALERSLQQCDAPWVGLGPSGSRLVETNALAASRTSGSPSESRSSTAIWRSASSRMIEHPEERSELELCAAPRAGNCI